MVELDAEVVVVGFGPVGQTLAALLGRRGRSVLVLERQRQMYDRPRAVALDNEVMRILAGVGIADHLDDFCLPSWQYDWQNAQGQTLIHFEFGVEPGSGRPINATFHQPSLERRLIEAVTALPSVTVRRGATVVDLRDDGDRAVVTYEDTDGVRREVTALYVVGCDGANSRVRDHIGPELDDQGFFSDWAVLDVLPHDQEREWSPSNLQICDPARPTTVVSAGPGRRRWEFLLLPDETPEMFATDDRAWELLEPWDLSPDNAEMERATVYRFRALCARTWRRGRVLVAGDAAHLMPPFFGQGMCSGIRDAANLAWKLDAVVAGLASAALLDTFTSERVAHVQHAIAMSVELGKVICLTDADAVAARDAQMLAAGGRPDLALPPVPPARLGPGVVHRRPDGTTVPPGSSFVAHGVVRLADGRTGPHDDLVGPRFVLGGAHDLRPYLTPESVQRFGALGGVVEQIVPGDRADVVDDGPWRQVADVGGYYLPHLRDAGSCAALVRPDYYLFGVAAEPEDVQVLLDDLLTQLAAPVRGEVGG